MALGGTLVLVAVATAADGVHTGASLDQAIKQLPARHQIGMVAFSAYSRAADLGPGIVWYALIGIGAAILMIAAAVVVSVQAVQVAQAWPIYAAAGLSVAHSLATTRAAPTNFSQRRVAGDEERLRAIFARFERWQTREPLDGNSSDQVSLLAAVEALAAQVRADQATDGAEAADQQERPHCVADGGLYSQATMARLNAAGIAWVSCVPARLTAAQTSLARRDDAAWQPAADGQTRWWGQELALPQGRERWVVMRTQAGERQARATLERQAGKARDDRRKRLWHLSQRAFACEADARVALAQETKTWPAWLKLQPAQVRVEPRYAQRGRPRPGDVPTGHDVYITATCEVDEGQVAGPGGRPVTENGPESPLASARG